MKQINPRKLLNNSRKFEGFYHAIVQAPDTVNNGNVLA